jgi:type I restriction enzyme S subunit
MSTLPDGWYRTTVGKSAKFLTGYPFASARFSSSGIQLIRGSNVKRSVIDWSADIAKHWPRVEVSLRAYELEDGDIVIAMDGALVGRSYARITERHLPAYLVQRVARLRGTKVDQGLLYAWIGSNAFAQHVDAVKTHTAIPHISPHDIRGFPIDVPIDPSEQRTIADALSDADRQVTALERLIAKKKAIKQGMAQQLLTGRTRLPGFAGPWRECRLGDILTVRHGRSQKGVEAKGGKYPILATGGEIGRTDTPLYSKPSVLVGRKGTIDRPQFQGTPFWTVDTLFYTEIDAVADPKCVFYMFTMIDWRSMNEASGVPSLSSGRVESVACSLPSVDEQRAIRRVLDDGDWAITVLRTRLAKAQAIKHGMMQQLLTARTRLPVMEEVAA